MFTEIVMKEKDFMFTFHFHLRLKFKQTLLKVEYIIYGI